MIIHIGWDVCVDSADVVALLSKDGALAPETKAYLKRLEDDGRLVKCGEGDRSYVILDQHGEEYAYESAINTQTLLKRFFAHGLYDIDEQPITFEGE
ncbi:DUF370 domain-containing protein [Christensenellaceae bacterium OttesenSCG-928-M15]|nr:DUF370 domain-containing protein [Christensenellaceae bacterium OttesenSCG-928-M15]